MDRYDGGRERHGELQRAVAHAGAAVHRHHHGRGLGLLDQEGSGGGEAGVEPVVVASRGQQQGDGRGHRQHGDPGALHELGRQDHRQGRGRGHRADQVDRQPALVAAGLFAPVGAHAGLAPGEGQKGPDRDQRDPPVGDAAKRDQQGARRHGQKGDADRKHQAAVQGRERAGQIAVLRHQLAKARKGHETGVGRQAEHREQARHRHIVHHATPGDGGGQLGQHALVSRLGLVHGAQAIGVGDQRDPGQQQAEHRAYDRERHMSLTSDGRLERADAVGHRLHPGHGRAAAGEGAQQQPQADGLARMAEPGRGDHRRRMTAMLHQAKQPRPDQPEEARHEDVGRQGEQQPGLRRAAQVGQGDQHEHAQAQRQGLGRKRGDGRGQCAHPGRYADRDVEHIVDHDRGGGEKARVAAEVLLGHRIGAAVGRIRHHGLPIREVERHQQHKDGRHHRRDPVQAGCAERDHHRQGGFRPVGGGTEPVQTHGRHGLEPADLSAVLLAVGQLAPERQVQ